MPTRAATAKAEAENMRVTRSRAAPAYAVASLGTDEEKKVSSSASPTPTKKANGAARGRKATGKGGKGKAKQVFCTCRGKDDGRPMVQCAECDDWFHFDCVGLDEDEASDIAIYICPPCTEKTGRHTVMNYEGSDAVEPVSPVVKPKAKTNKSRKTPVKRGVDVSDATESDDAHGETGDEDYVDGEGEAIRNAKGKVRAEPLGRGSANFTRERGQNASRRVLSDGEDDSDGGKSTTSAVAQKTVAPPMSPIGEMSRRRSSTASLAEAPQPPKKRQRTVSAAQRESSASAAPEDKLRKHVLDDFSKLFNKIFQAYPHVRSGGEDDALLVEKKWDEMTEEEKTEVGDAANGYAAAAETALHEACGEDKQKFKSLYLMLKFNLSKDDRAAVHRRIASGSLAAETLVHMSPEDLASEDQQKSRRELEDEALAQSILQKSRAPTAKITHKGFQDIEDVTGERADQRAREDAIEKEEEARARRERERLARLKPVQAHQVQSPTSSSVPPESPLLQTPTTPAGTGWGGPPPVPMHALSVGGAVMSPVIRPPATPMFFNSTSDTNASVEHDIDLGDFIHMDDDLPLADGNDKPSVAVEIDKQSFTAPSHQEPSTGLSPFAPGMPDVPRASFDLSSVWTQQKPPERVSTPPTPVEELDEPMELEHDAMDIDSGGGQDAEKLDFDMFLNNDEKEDMSKPAEPLHVLTPEETFEKLPHVWSGAVSMPIDTMTPEETKVFARQVGGRTIEHDSPLWRTLCPSEVFRIDGRVPVSHSSKYMLESRMAPAKELVAVALTPESEQALGVLQAISGFLKGKDRHGLVFPWGKRGKEWGSELYIVPLSKNEPIPESIELLDNLKLPRQRKEDCFVGVWVLNRGKLQPPPPPVARPLPQPQAQVLLPPQAVPPALQNAVSPPQTLAFSAPNPISLPANLLAAMSSLAGASMHANPIPPAPAAYTPAQPPVVPNATLPPAAAIPPTPPAALAGLANMSLEELAALPMDQLQSIAQLLQNASATHTTATPPHPQHTQNSWAPPRNSMDAGYNASPQRQPDHGQYQDRDYYDRSGPSRGGGYGPRGGDRDRDRSEFRGRGRGRGRGGSRGRGRGDFGGGRGGGGGSRRGRGRGQWD